MQVYKQIFFFIILLLLSSPALFGAHLENESDELAYARAEKFLKKLKITSREAYRIREIIVVLDFRPYFYFKGLKVTRSGDFGTEIKFEYKSASLAIPEWCLLVFLDRLEKQEIYPNFVT